MRDFPYPYFDPAQFLEFELCLSAFFFFCKTASQCAIDFFMWKSLRKSPKKLSYTHLEISFDDLFVNFNNDVLFIKKNSKRVILYLNIIMELSVCALALYEGSRICSDKFSAKTVNFRLYLLN